MLKRFPQQNNTHTSGFLRDTRKIFGLSATTPSGNLISRTGI